MRVGGWAWRRRGCHCWAGESELPDHDSNAEQGTRSARAPSSSRRRRLAWRSRGPHGSCIDIEERDPIGLLGAGDQSWDLVGKPGQDSGTDLVELLDVTVSEGSQVGAQRRGRPAASRQRRLGDRRGAHAGPGHQHRPGHRSTQPDPGPSDSALCRYRHKADYAEVLVMPSRRQTVGLGGDRPAEVGIIRGLRGRPRVGRWAGSDRGGCRWVWCVRSRALSARSACR